MISGRRANLSRYKGRLSTKQIERDNPYFVDIQIPEGGLGRRLDKMHAWHLERGTRAKMGSGGLWTARFCFADPASAEAFKVEFAKDLQIPPMPKDDPVALIEWAHRYIQDS
jgi:hypothetical protein